MEKLSKPQKVAELLNLIPNVEDDITNNIKNVIKQVPCCEKTGWNGYEVWKNTLRIDKVMKEGEKEIARKRFKNKNKQEYDVVAIIPKEKWQDFCEFCGYRGYKDKSGKVIIDHTFELVDFEYTDYKGAKQVRKKKKWKYPYYPGEAVPAPVDEETQEEIGILLYQLAGFRFIEDHDNILILWPRGHGKTWLLAWYIEWNMKHSLYKCMYLSITDVYNDVANWVYDWADIQGYIPEAHKAKGAQSQRRQTPKSFTLKNGSVFKAYPIKAKEIRGKHGFHIYMDDVVEEGSQTNPSYQVNLERRWNATLSKMRRGKLIIVNTRVYRGDFIEYLIRQFEKKHAIMLDRMPEDANKWKLYTFVLTPYIKHGDYYYNNYITG